MNSADDLPIDPDDPADPLLSDYGAEPGEQLDALGDHLILEIDTGNEDRTPSGLVLPKTAAPPANSYRRFRVLAVGPMCTEDRLSEIPEPELGPGDLVIAPLDELGLYREGGVTYYIGRYDMIAAIIRRG